MALKGDRVILETDITHVNNSVAVPGVILVYGPTAGSGNAMGDNAGQVQLTAGSASGSKPAGMLVNNFVSIDQTRYHRNWQRDEMVVGERATLVKKGVMVTDQIYPGLTVAQGDPAYLGPSGLLVNVKSANGGLVASPPVGQFESAKDELGYARVTVQLPSPVF